MMARDHDVQALSDTDITVYEAVAGGASTRDEVARSADLPEESVRQSLAKLVAQGHVVPQGDGFALGEHTFGLDY
ncbi:hypothetical protein ACIBG8_52965 [Nonomuraea sp. NPDC050556]|uniref:hypothetical protein n=1 Tax=Nonomuraea sp. NPDC050556 TaxID=3364369 RepID=UPI0037A3041E